MSMPLICKIAVSEQRFMGALYNRLNSLTETNPLAIGGELAAKTRAQISRMNKPLIKRFGHEQFKNIRDIVLTNTPIWWDR